MNFADSNCDDEVSLEKEMPFRLYSFHSRQELVYTIEMIISTCERRVSIHLDCARSLASVQLLAWMLSAYRQHCNS